MTRDEALARLKEILAENGDVEMAHIEADGVLLALINDAEISEAFNVIDKWYA